MVEASSGEHPGRKITGRMVLIGLICFFLFIMVVNAIMARFAITTFAGVETESSYKAGLRFQQDRAAAEQQGNLHWQVSVHIESPEASAEPQATTLREVVVEARDAEDKPLTGLIAEGRLSHPTDARRDVPLDMVPLGAGRYEAKAEAGAGQWVLVIDFNRGEERVFRSRNRVHLP